MHFSIFSEKIDSCEPLKYKNNDFLALTHNLDLDLAKMLYAL